MTWSTYETIDLIERWLPHELIDSESRASLGEVSRWLPDAFCSYYLECRLEEEDSRVDLLASATNRGRPGGERAARGRRMAEVAHLGESSSSWASVARFFHVWDDPSTRLHARIPFIWLEFDRLRRASRGVPDPCFHACVDRDYLGEDELAASPEEQNDCREVLATTLEVLLRGPLPSAIMQSLHTCFRRISPEGRLIHVSAMLARAPAAIKLYGCVPAHHLKPYLQEIGWPGSFDDLDGLLQEFSAPDTSDEMIYFDLAFEQEMTPYIGVVFSQLQLNQAENRDPTRAALLDRLVNAGLCAPCKRDVLVQWPGNARVSYRGSPVPARMRRWLDLKVSFHPGDALRAKAYLGFMPVFSLF